MVKTSAGLLMYNLENNELKFFLIHPGGPFWKNKDLGAWSIPKGEKDNEAEGLLDVARREFNEETGISSPNDNSHYIELGKIKQKSGKIVYALAFKGNFSGKLNCTSFIDIEWPTKSGKFIKIPEVDKAEMLNINEAKKKINSCQAELIDRLIEIIGFKNESKMNQERLF